MATLLRENGETKEVLPKVGGQFSLKELQKAVEGYIEVVSMRGSTSLLIVNEDGHQKGMTVNREATKLAGQMIVGPVLLCQYGEVR